MVTCFGVISYIFLGDISPKFLMLSVAVMKGFVFGIFFRVVSCNCFGVFVGVIMGLSIKLFGVIERNFLV